MSPRGSGGLATLAALATSAALGAGCSDSSGGDSRDYAYEVPTAHSSPWPMMRRTRANDGRSPVIPSSLAEEPWRFATGKGIFSVPVIGHDGSVLVGSADRFFYSLSPEGELHWSFETGEIIDSAAAVAADGSIHVPSADGFLYALDPDGNERWRFRAHHAFGEPDQVLGTKCHDSATIGGTSNWFEGNVVIGPGGQLYAGNDNFRMYGLDPDGSERFAFHPGRIPFGAVWSAATTRADGSAVFGALDTFLYSISVDGECQWRTNLGAPISASPAQGPDGTIYVGSWDDNLYALDGDTGAVRWTFSARDHIYSSPALGEDGTIYFGSTDGTFYALSPEGQVRWTFDVIDPIRSSPSVAGDGTIYFSAGNGVLYALNPDGTRLWSWDSTTQDRNDLNSSPVIGRDRLYLGSEDGSVLGVPHAWCLESADPRCSTDPNEDLPADGELLIYVTPGGRNVRIIEEPVQRASSLSFRLIVREGGFTQDVGLDPASVTVRSDPAADFDVLTQAGGQWTNLLPRDFLAPATTYTVEVAGRYRTGLFSSAPVSASFRFTTVSEDGTRPPLSVEPDRVSAFNLRNLAPYQPPVIVSLNQIGFDSVDFLASVIHRFDDERVAMWMTTAAIGTDGRAIDPQSPSMIALDVDTDGSSFVMSGSGLTLVTGGPPIVVRDFRVASRFDGAASFDAGTAFFAQAGCAAQGGPGALLVLFGLCNESGDFLSVGTIRGAPFEGDPIDRRPAGLTVTEVEIVGRSVRARFESDGYRLDEHLPALVLIDDAAGSVVQMDYRAQLDARADATGELESVTLRLPDGVDVTPGAGYRAVVLADLFPVASVEL